MKLAQLPSLLADIVPPPPPDIMPEHLESRGSLSLGFLVLAVVAAGFLWWLRQHRAGAPDLPVPPERS